MDFTAFFSEYISPLTLLICLVVGYIIKSCIKNDTVHNFIPLIVAILGVVICAWDAMALTPDVIAVGLVSGLASTGLYELVKQIVQYGNFAGIPVLNNEEDKKGLHSKEDEANG